MVYRKEKGERNKSIKWRIFQYLLGFSALLLIILWLFQTVFLDTFYKNIKRAEIKKDAILLAEFLWAGDMDRVRDVITKQGDMEVEIWVQDGESYIFTMRPNMYEIVEGTTGFSYISQYTEQEKLNYYTQAKKQGGLVTETSFDEKREQELLLCTVVLDDSASPNLLLVSADLMPVGATVKTLRIQLIYISGILIVLTAFIALLLARRVASPIERLNKGAERLAAGDFTVTFGEKEYQEVSELSSTLDYAAKELSKTDQLQKELIANVSHDLRTPLTLIGGYAEMMRDMPEEVSEENMQVIIDETKRLNSLVKSLVDLSKIQAGVAEEEVCLFSITALTKEIVNRLALLTEKEGYRILFSYESEAMVYARKGQIEQVIYNYLTNAITHTGAEKEVFVTQHLENGRVTISVRDTGEGIAEEALKDIWERYYKVDKAHKRAVVGSGLGLSIVKAVLEGHDDAEYGVESTPNIGSIFWFSLPLEEEQ
ncbi:MAG: sensor histidine kinase [Christensenellaceae bacterium]|jgi:signal transduction histidine kinase